ncbi:hypothetical protein FBUS_06492 [Fasciolopsis buskii]|uniref:Uncharacterized protein n=1 Tax=Fasciolopsis buskii TaxID=27845 RepID=A0A8E0RUH1_9TREM|nr:hypothetical protein FBUS_06492 [Fasciolopsis buski]
MNDSEFSGPVKNALRNIILCSGEPFLPSEEVLNLFYRYLISVTTSWILKFRTVNLTLEGVLTVLRHQPRKLNLVFNYFRVLSGACDMNLAEDDVSFDSSRPEPTLTRFSELCSHLNITVPADRHTPCSKSPFERGRKLRLVRIDRKISSMSIEEYLNFTKLRQTASLLNLIKSGPPPTFNYLVQYCKKRVVHQCFDVNQVHGTQEVKEDRVGLCLLAHLITDDILDLIDIVLYLRQRLGIELSSPLTPVEIKQGVQRLQSLSGSL